MAGKSIRHAVRGMFFRTDILGSRRLSMRLLALITVMTLCVCFCVSWAYVAETGRRFEHATDLLAQDRFAEAIAAFDTVVERDPDAVLAWCGRGLCQLNMGMPAEALYSYDAALAAGDGSIDALIGKSICLSELGRKPESLKVLERLLEVNPGNRRALSLIRTLELKR